MSTHDHPAPDQPISFLTIIAHHGKAGHMARFALENGALAAYHSYAHGTVPGHILSLLGLSGVRRELVTLPVPRDLGPQLLDRLCQEFHIDKETNGIAFLQSGEMKGPDEPPSEYVLIAAVVNEGDGEYVVESARKSHPVGASILRALGSADHSKKTFDFDIIPQKEVVLIVAKSCYLDKLYKAIYEEMASEAPGRGILFTMALDQVAGMLDTALDCDDEEDPDNSPVPQDTASGQNALLIMTDRGHSAEIVVSVEQCGGTGATIIHFRRTDTGSRGWYGPLGDLEKELVLTITSPGTADCITDELLRSFKKETDRPLSIGSLPVMHFIKLSGE